MPRRHFDDPTTRRDVGAKESGRERVMQGWWGAPRFRVPIVRRHGKRGMCKNNSDTVQTYGTSHTTKHSFTGGHLGGYTFEACVSGRFKNVEGSSRSRVVVEVVVHGTVVVEVVVHGRRGSSRSRRR